MLIFVIAPVPISYNETVETFGFEIPSSAFLHLGKRLSIAILSAKSVKCFLSFVKIILKYTDLFDEK